MHDIASNLNFLCSNTAGIASSAVFRTNSRHILTYKGLQTAKIDVIWCKKYSPDSFGWCATAVKS